MTVHSWEEIVREIEEEADRFRIKQLARQLNDAMIAEEKAKVQFRLAMPPGTQPLNGGSDRV